MFYYIWNKKNSIGLCHTSHAESRDRYPIEITNNHMDIMEDKLLVSNIVNHFIIHQYDQLFLTSSLVHLKARVFLYIYDDKEEKANILHF